jgi:hypothetical protein
MTKALTPGFLRVGGGLIGGVPLGLLTALGHGLALAQPAAQAQLPSPEIYTCQDARGRKLTSDRPIAECRDREQNILNPSGTIKTRIGPALTAKERADLEAKDKAEQAQRAMLEEEKRRDRALLTRYPTPSAHQKERLAALEHINRVKQTAQVQVTDLQTQKAKLIDEMAFYEKDPSRAPQRLKRQLDEVNQTLAAQGRFLADKDAETARVNARFDAERLRLEPLWQLATAPKSD